MKEFEIKAPYFNENKVELNVKKQQEIEYLLEGSITPKKGHFVWEINEQTGEIKKAQYKCDTVTINLKMVKDAEKLIVKPNHIYISALNIANAQKKYYSNQSQSFYLDKAPIMKLKDIFN